MKKWMVIKETDVSPDKWFPVLRHEVRLPNDVVIDDYFIAPVGVAAMVLPVLSNGDIVLVKQYKHGLGEIVIELPAGAQQEGKSIEESALAELEEETGTRTTLDRISFLGKYSCNPTKTDHVTHCFVAKGLEFNSKQNLDETECIEIIQASPKEVLGMLKAGEIWVADSVAALSMAFLKGVI